MWTSDERLSGLRELWLDFTVSAVLVVHRPCTWEVDLLRVCLLMGYMDGEWSPHGSCIGRTSLSTGSASLKDSFLLGPAMRQQV